MAKKRGGWSNITPEPNYLPPFWLDRGPIAPKHRYESPAGYVAVIEQARQRPAIWTGKIYTPDGQEAVSLEMHLTLKDAKLTVTERIAQLSEAVSHAT